MKNIACIVGFVTLFSIGKSFGQVTADSLLVPIDYADPNGETIYLHYEFGSPYNASLPTVFAIADGQQFWARPGRAARFQKELFGDKMNVLVFFGRPQSTAIEKHIREENGNINWKEAYRLFNSNQWIEDIESIRKHVLGNQKVNLYGRSGGGLLLLQYLAKYGIHVDKAFCQTAVYHELEPRLGYKHDKFWKEITDYKPELGNMLLRAIDQKYFDRDDIILNLQRQNFFVEASEINSKRELLIEALDKQDTAVFDSLKVAYQVDAVKAMEETTLGITAAVRQYEFFMPYDELLKESTGTLNPNVEAIQHFAQPLITLYHKHEIPYPSIDITGLHDVNAQVMILAARWDHTVDYRGQFYLAGLLKNSILFIADDNHVFSKIYETDSYNLLVQNALLSEKESEAMKQCLNQTKTLRWSEWK